MPESNPLDLLYSLIGYPNETEWIEFKEGNSDPLQIGRDISALANSATYFGRDMAYKIWGVNDADHSLKGTLFNPYDKKKGNQNLLIWLKTMLSANANYDFTQFEHQGKLFVILKIRASVNQPVCFQQQAYIRVGSSTTKLPSGSSKEIELWKRLQRSDFEGQIAEENLESAAVFELLNIPAYFSLMGQKMPHDSEKALIPLFEQDMLRRQDDNKVSITNLGALLLANKMSEFPSLRKREIRVLRFAGKGNLDILEDKTFGTGYALALQEAYAHIISTIPSNEITEGAFRKVRAIYPEQAIRELLSNIVVHQDLSDTGSGPLVGVYENRIEFSNPGTTLIPISRVLNAQPKTRNNQLVRLLRLMDLCEEGGTGWDRAVEACENAHLAAPKITSDEEMGTKVTLFRELGYRRMSKKERMDATYWHACLAYAQGEAMNNRSLRERFGLADEQKNTVAVSRLIKECCNSDLIKEEDPEAGAKYRRYIPFWA